MSAAILQAVPATTLDVDFWVDLRERQYVRVLHICRKLGATILSQTVVGLDDETTVNFLYSITGLRSFDAEWKRALRLRLHGTKVKVLPLARIITSKEAAGRPKDLAHLPILRETARLRSKYRRQTR